jgi:hypothetical protein
VRSPRATHARWCGCRRLAGDGSLMRSSQRAWGRQRGGAGQGGEGRGSPEKVVDGKVAVHSLEAAVCRRQADAVVEGGGGRVLQHGKVEGRGDTWQK